MDISYHKKDKITLWNPRFYEDSEFLFFCAYSVGVVPNSDRKHLEK